MTSRLYACVFMLAMLFATDDNSRPNEACRDRATYNEFSIWLYLSSRFDGERGILRSRRYICRSCANFKSCLISYSYANNVDGGEKNYPVNLDGTGKICHFAKESGKKNPPRNEDRKQKKNYKPVVNHYLIMV